MMQRVDGVRGMAAQLGTHAASAVLIVCALHGMAGGARAQNLLAGSGRSSVRLFGSDEAVLEAGEVRKDLPCTVTHEKPVLGFDLRFHAEYEVAVPLRELAGSENLLTILFRVTPLDAAGRPLEPTYFSQKIRVPSVEEDAKGEAYLHGSFDAGEGRYKVNWLMRDRAERVCADAWESEAMLPVKDKSMQLMVGSTVVKPSEAEQFREEPPVARDAEPLSVKVLVNFAPQNARASTLQPADTSALVSILRTIARDRRIGRFSVVAFNMQEQQVLHRQQEADKIDFPAIGKALDNIKLGTIDLARLANKKGETEFLEGLLKSELPAESKYDGIIFAGPKTLLEHNVPTESLKQFTFLDAPLFYMNYNLYPQAAPWRDAIGHAVKFLRGAEYTITRPRDLWYSVSEMIGQIAKAKSHRTSGQPSGQ